VFGSNVMQRYYFVYDATDKPLRLGFGLRSDTITYDLDDADNVVPDDPGDDGNDPFPFPIPD
jgi:hypothetical protein